MTIAFSLLWLASCGAGEPETTTPAVAEEELTITRLAEGWAHTLSLEGERSFEVRGEVFRAVAFPRDSGAALHCTSPADEKRWSVDAATFIECDPGTAETIHLRSDGALELLRPRWSDRRRRGTRRLLIVADTLRSDHATTEHMPEATAHFSKAIRFQRAQAAAAWTLPSVASLFTGQQALRHRAPDGSLISLAADVETLAESLSGQGEVPVAVIANPTVSHENGYSQGFELFVAPPPGAITGAGLPDAEWVNRHALAADRWFPDLDLFLYLQYMETHAPYRNHETGEVVHGRTTGAGEAPSPAELEAMRRAYASEAGYLSRALDALLTNLGEVDLAVFTADHGEELFEHGGFGHGPGLWPEVVQVPLWIQGTELEPAVIEAPVSLAALHRFLVHGDTAWFEHPPRLVSHETFSHGPPRWGAHLDGHHVTWFAQNPRQREPEKPRHPTAMWLEENHPGLITHPPPGPSESPGDLMRSTLRALAGEFRGLKAGTFLFSSGKDLRLTARGVQADQIWIWGEPRVDLEIADHTGDLCLTLRRTAPGTLVFLPRAGDAPIELLEGAPPMTDRFPVTLPRHGAIYWIDPGRRKVQLQGIEETRQRLKALGYI